MCFIDSNYAPELEKNLRDYGDFRWKPIVISGKYEEKIIEVLENKRNYNVFLYIDPLFTNIDYEEGFRETLDEIFDYVIYEDEDNVIIKVHMDYLKQHNCAAFPTWIFFRNAEEYPNIEYRITSKNKAEIVHKVIKVEAVNV